MMQGLCSVLLWISCSLLLLSTGIQGQDEEQCSKVFKKNKVSPNFAKIITHLLHSLTLQDLRTHFKSSATEGVPIPALNPNLTAEPRVLPSPPDLPLNNSFNVFNNPALDALDSVLSHMDDPNWGYRNAPVLEHLVHELHVMAVYVKAGKAYHQLRKKANRPKPAKYLCGCLSRTHDELIEAWLAALDVVMQGNPNTRVAFRRYCNCPYSSSISQNFRTGKTEVTVSMPPGMPLLETEDAWNVWKTSMVDHLNQDGESMSVWMHQAALYMFCKLDQE